MLQDFTYCGPEKERCVANQTFKDKSCLVPCTGLYADIADDSQKQTTQAFEENMMKGNKLVLIFDASSVFPFQPYSSGLHTLTHELSQGRQIESKERLNVALHQMFPASTDGKADEVKSASESYHKYKRKYVKHLCFNPDNENLSKCFLCSQCLYNSSYNAGACTIGGGVHLL